MPFQWDRRNVEHLSKHNVSPEEAEYVVAHAQPPYPQVMGEGKYLVWGVTAAGRHLQVIFAFKSPEEVDFFSMDMNDLAELMQKPDVPVTRVIHAMDLTPALKKRFRRRRKP